MFKCIPESVLLICRLVYWNVSSTFFFFILLPFLFYPSYYSRFSGATTRTGRIQLSLGREEQSVNIKGKHHHEKREGGSSIYWTLVMSQAYYVFETFNLHKLPVINVKIKSANNRTRFQTQISLTTKIHVTDTLPSFLPKTMLKC